MRSPKFVHVLYWLGVVGLTITLGTSSAWAQTFTGGVRGVVSDANGVVPGVTVTLLNEATNVSRETVSNEVGQYNFPAVTPGTYTVKTQLTGYKSFERAGIRVATQQFVQLDITMELGTIQETITVTGEAPLIDSSTASTGGVLDRQLLEALPAPGRNAFLVGVTVPTVMPVGDPQFNRQQDQTNASRISLGGGGIRANNYLLDGVAITELGGRAILNPTIEAVEEIKVQVHTYDAEMGQTGGGVFNVATKSGANDFHGSGFFQTRPVWGQNLNFFDDLAGRTKEQTGLDQSYYRLYGGAIGGPIFQNRTFFWAATEGYRSFTTRALNFVWPSLRQRNGDFSGTSIGGIPVRLFNPWCRSGVASARCPATGTGSLATNGEFTGAIIPRTHPAANPVGFNLINAWPTNTVGGANITPNEDGEANARDTARLVDAADMFTIKVDHRFSEKTSLSGFYLYNKTDEPGSGIMPPEFVYLENTAEFFTTLRRRPQALVFNNTNILNDTTVLTLRYGWTTWGDSNDFGEFPAGLASLGFNQTYVNGVDADGRQMFPALSFNENTSNVGGWGGTRRRWNNPFTVNGTLTKLWGNHSFKLGADFRQWGITTTTETAMAGSFRFDRRFTSAPGINGSGHELASLILGLPVAGSGGTGSNVPVNRGELEWFTRGYGAYIQDDWRLSSKMSLNFGVRLEHGDGLREIENRQTVGFDPNLANPIDALVPKTGTLLQGQTLRGGLLYAGVDGAPEYQGDPPALTAAPRAGVSYSLNNRTVVRGGYGTFVAPFRTSAATHGQGPFARTTALSQTEAPNTEVPITTLDSPYPAILQPIGSSLGALGLVGGNLEVIDQNKGPSYVHQYSVDVQRELPGNMAVTVGYTGATGRDIGFGGSNTVAININQIDPDRARQLFPGPGGTWNAAALNASVPNPFFGIAAAGELGRRATVPAGQLIRPFPQFGDINVFEVTEGGKRQYHAMILELDKRVSTSGWGGRLSYTLSSTKDNQFGETNTYASVTQVPQNFYDLDAEYSLSNFDSKHRIILAPIVKIPGPADGRAALLLGGWTVSSVVELVSGAPLNPTLSAGTSNTALGLLGGRQRPNVTGDPNIGGSDEERVDTAVTPGARWFDRNAFANPGSGQYGSAPRTLGDARLQFRKNLDVVVAKDTRFGGGQTAQIRFEFLNLTNTPKFGGPTNTTDTATFGRVTTLRGFMRIWQISFRYGF